MCPIRILSLSIYKQKYGTIPLGGGNEDLAYKLANGGYSVVLTCVTHLYFDMAHYKSFEEPGYYWGAFTDIDKPFSFIPFDYFKNSNVDKDGLP